MTVRVCLFRDEIKWMENFGEKMRRKMGRKTFLSMFGWMEMKENRWWGSSIFSPCPPKWKENWREKLRIIFGQKCPRAIAHGIHPCCFSSHLFFPLLDVARLHFFFFFFLLIYYASDASLFFFFFFSFDLLGKLV